MPGEHITKGCLWKCKKKKERQRDKVFTNVHNRRCHLSPHICQELKLARLKPCIKFPPAAFATRVSYLSQDSSRIQILLFVAFQNPPANAGETGLIPGSERSLEKGMATHSSILAWRIPWTEEPGGLQSMGSQRVRHDWAHTAHPHTNTQASIYMGEGSGASLQYCCLKNPMLGGTW